MFDAVFLHAGDEFIHILVPNHIVNVQVDVAAVSGDFVFFPNMAGCSAKGLDWVNRLVVKGEGSCFGFVCCSCVVGLLGFLNLCVSFSKMFVMVCSS